MTTCHAAESDKLYAAAYFDRNLDKIRELNFDDRFIRIWRFYLAASIASFASNRTNVIQAEIKHV